MMIAHITADPKITKMALAALQDSGWYTVDMSSGEHYEWGKGAGCGIFNVGCPTDGADEFCSEVNSFGCSDSRVYRTVCDMGEFNQECPVDIYMQSCKVKPKAGDSAGYGLSSLCLATQVGV